jgi:hypothetical protein
MPRPYERIPISVFIVSQTWQQCNSRALPLLPTMRRTKGQGSSIGYSPRQWRYAERGSFVDEIQRTGKMIYSDRGTHRKAHQKIAARAKLRKR